MQESFTLADIERLTGVSADRLRYILDSNILPGMRNGKIVGKSSPGRGVARTFTGYISFGITVAVLMLDAGFKRDALKKCLDILCDYAKGTRDIRSVMLYQAYERKEVAAIELGDGQNVRLVHAGTQTGEERSEGWIQVQTGGKVVEYAPLVTIRIDVAKLRTSLQR